MARPYSEDLRERLVRDVEAGASRRGAAAKYHVSPSFAVKLLQLWQATGSLAPRRHGGHKPFALAEHTELVLQLLAEQPDQTLEELRARLAAAGIQVGRSSIDRFLKAQGLTRKKRRSMRPSRSGPTSPPPAPLGGPARPG